MIYLFRECEKYADISKKTIADNDGTGEFIKGDVIEHFTYGTSQDLFANSFDRTNYIFKEWNTEIDGSGTSYEDKESVRNLTSKDEG